VWGSFFNAGMAAQVMRSDGSRNHHNRPVLFYCPRDLSGDCDQFSQFSLSGHSQLGSLTYRCFPVEMTARLFPWLSFSALGQTNSWHTNLTLWTDPHFALTFAHPQGCSALATSSDRTYQLFLGPRNVSAKFFGQFDGFRANFDMDIGDITTFVTTFIRGSFMCGCHLHMHIKDVGTNRNSCFFLWEHVRWSHCFRVTFPVVALQEFSFIYGFAFSGQNKTKVKATIAYGPREQINFSFGGKFEWRNCMASFFMGERSIGDQFAVKTALVWKLTDDTKLSVARMTDHYVMSLQRKIQNGIVLTPSFLYKDGLIGMKLGIVAQE
jgi:hypothetical protein